MIAVLDSTGYVKLVSTFDKYLVKTAKEHCDISMVITILFHIG